MNDLKDLSFWANGHLMASLVGFVIGRVRRGGNGRIWRMSDGGCPSCSRVPSGRSARSTSLLIMRELKEVNCEWRKKVDLPMWNFLIIAEALGQGRGIYAGERETHPY